jgi:hypothetical protein
MGLKAKDTELQCLGKIHLFQKLPTLHIGCS